MRYSAASLIGIMTALAIPAFAQAQAYDENSFTRANWNVSLHGGTSNHGRLLLQRAGLPGGGTGERVLKGRSGYNVGAGIGADILSHTGLRVDYTFAETDLAFRTDEGNGSDALDLDDIGQLQSHSVALEVIRYMLQRDAGVTPYASVGLVGSWYGLDDEGTQFRTGALASLGLKIKMGDAFDVRMEAASASMRSPFTGDDSYRVTTGTTVDEPTRVTRSGLRFLAVYNFGRPQVGAASAD